MMESFGNEMMKQSCKEFAEANKTEAVASTKQAPNISVAPARAIDHQLTKNWYAVINRKGGMNSIFPEWIGGAAPYVTGTSSPC
jgi:hypothetical protein